ncbi:hypothetical protein AAFC00_000993 [Neodothiora populina]|uniref:Uncharacterized protein n=1 Tax=Neodothiora populina TaxID=2781224 RepID=A0ABR3PMH6_9PEZI
MAAAGMTVAEALPALTQSLTSALSGLPSEESILPPSNGITLLDAKNELFLSYLQTLALRNLAVIRSVGKHIKGKSSADVTSSVLDQDLDDQMVKDLVKHRVYLEKGVRPLEDRLKYQIDKVVRAADDETRHEQQKSASTTESSKKITSKAATTDASGSEDDDDDEDDNEDSEIDELSYRPNAAAFTKAPTANGAAPTTSAREQAMQEDGIYRPPRITATVMPTTERKEAKDKRPMRSAAIDEYVADELSTAPSAQPSIGSTIVAGGRRDKSARERKEEEERREYEESNLVRLPKESKKDRAKKAHKERSAYGGEDWRSLGDGLDRIERLTKKKSGSGGALERSRKRKNEDGQRDDGAGGADMGRDFERRKKRTMRGR